MRHALSFCLLLIASPALAQSIQMDLNPFGGRVTVTPPAEAVVTTARVEEVSGDGFHVTYRSSDTGYTQLEVVEPQGARATLWDGAQLVADDDVPTAATVRSGRWYRLVVTRHDGAVFERKLQSREGMRGTVRVFGFAAPAPAPVVVVPAGPAQMNAGQFARLVDAIEEESFSAQKLDVLRTAASDAWFTCDQVGEIIELFTFSNEKEAVKRLLSAR